MYHHNTLLESYIITTPCQSTASSPHPDSHALSPHPFEVMYHHHTLLELSIITTPYRIHASSQHLMESVRSIEKPSICR
jgi:hypothetical protein